MRLLHTADWHLGVRLRGRSRHEEQRAALEEICRIAESESIDAVILAGDVYDGYSPPAESESLYYETITRLSDKGRRGVVVIAGNHDSPDRLMASNPVVHQAGISTLGYPRTTPSQFEGSGSGFACIESAPSFARYRLASSEVLSLIALPYPSESRLRELLAEGVDDDTQRQANYITLLRQFMEETSQRFEHGGANIVVSHLFVVGGGESGVERPIQVGGAYSVPVDAFPANASYVALGHLHRPQEFQGKGDGVIRYSGSIIQQSFSEAEQEKSVTIVEVTNGRAEHIPVPLTSGRPLLKIAATTTDEVEHRLAAAPPGAWLSVSLSLSLVATEPVGVDYLETIQRIHNGIVEFNVQYERPDQLTQPPASILSLSTEEQFRRYVETRFNEPCDPEVIQLLNQLLINN